MATSVLIHGAWHGAWFWERVAPLLTLLAVAGGSLRLLCRRQPVTSSLSFFSPFPLDIKSLLFGPQIPPRLSL